MTYPKDKESRQLAPRRPAPLSVRAQKAIDVLTDIIESPDVEHGDRVALEDARAVLESYANREENR